jgi:hypothetical protein
MHESTAVAAGDGLYLVVWMEYANGKNPDVLGVRVRASDGQRLDDTPLLIGSGSNVSYRPAVAFDGTNFLVVWEEISGKPFIAGARVRASDGAVLDASPLYLSRHQAPGGYTLPQQAPAVAFDGTNYLVTWHGNYWDGQTVSSGVQAIRVRPSDGACLEPHSIVIAQYGVDTRVAYTDGIYLVTWTRGYRAEAARLSASTGQVLDATPIVLGGLGNSAVAAQNGEFLITWFGAEFALWARRVRASDGARLGTGDVVVGAAPAGVPEVTFDGVDYRIIWDGADAVRTVRVSSQGVVAAEGEQVLAELGRTLVGKYRGGSIASAAPGQVLATYANRDHTTIYTRAWMRLLVEGQPSVSAELSMIRQAEGVEHLGSAAAAGDGIYLVVWSDYLSGGDWPDILGVRVRASDGARLDATPLRISPGHSRTADLEPAVAFDGTNFLVVWQRNDPSPLIYGARVRASDGAVLDEPFLISRFGERSYSNAQLAPAVAFDGTNYLVAWNGYYWDGQQRDHVLGIRIRTDGTFIEPVAFAIAEGGRDVRVAHADGNYLVTWTKNQNIEAARVSAATGQVLDTPALSLAASPGNERSPAVAARSGEFLVTWIGGDNVLWAQRVRASDGAKLHTEDIAVAPFASGYPEVTFDGLDYRLAWSDPSGKARRMLSRRVSSQGEVAAEAELLISEVHVSASGYRGAIAAADRGRLLITYQAYDYAARKGLARMRLVSEVRAEPEPCTSKVPSLVLNGASPLVLECGPGPYQDPGAQAFDGCGNPIEVYAYNTGTDSSGPGPLMGYEGSYSVAYSAWDSQGRTVNAVRTVNVDDRSAPVLRLIGPSFMTHTCGSQWVDPGVAATDACYGNLSEQVGHTGEVNGWAVGTYTVTYWLTDSGGNSAVPVTRTVEVSNCPW